MKEQVTEVVNSKSVSLMCSRFCELMRRLFSLITWCIISSSCRYLTTSSSCLMTLTAVLLSMPDIKGCHWYNAAWRFSEGRNSVMITEVPSWWTIFITLMMLNFFWISNWDEIVSEKTYVLCFDTHYCLESSELSLTFIEIVESLLCEEEEIFTEYLNLSVFCYLWQQNTINEKISQCVKHNWFHLNCEHSCERLQIDLLRKNVKRSLSSELFDSSYFVFIILLMLTSSWDLNIEQNVSNVNFHVVLNLQYLIIAVLTVNQCVICWLLM